MIFPPFINQGALVALVSPAGKISPSVVKNAENFLDSLGYRHIRGKYLADSWHQFSATDQHRADDLNSMMNNPEVAVIWCMRGGYGAIRILDKLNFEPLKNNPKWIVGYSDITVLHSVLQNNLGIASIHGPMPKNLENGNYQNSGMLALWNMLRGVSEPYKTTPHELNKHGHSKGILIGGNITLLNTLKGSQFDFDPIGKILFIEEISEYLYNLDRMMLGLKISGKLENLAGIIVGQMTDMQDNTPAFGFSAYEIIANAVKDYKYPVLFNFPAGHEKINQPLLLGAKIKLDITAKDAHISYC
jgi:muramoyltetrapeptide carboxypeptidase